MIYLRLPHDSGDIMDAYSFWNNKDVDWSNKIFYPEALLRYLEREEDILRGVMSVARPKNLLEGGCGEGRIIELIKNQTPCIEGVDYANKAVEDCQKKFSQDKNVHICQADLHKLSYANESYDMVILAYNTLGNIEHGRDDVLFEVTRVLKPLGLLYVSVYSDTAKEMQLEVYDNIGLGITHLQGDYIRTDNGLYSKRFEHNELSGLLEKFQLETVVFDIDEGLVGVGRKKS